MIITSDKARIWKTWGTEEPGSWERFWKWGRITTYSRDQKCNISANTFFVGFPRILYPFTHCFHFISTLEYFNFKYNLKRMTRSINCNTPMCKIWTKNSVSSILFIIICPLQSVGRKILLQIIQYGLAQLDFIRLTGKCTSIVQD